MRILFFFVHPSKYHVFKHTINHLKNNGNTVDIAIITKDLLEDLIKQEGWEYTNIFPEGRRNPGLPILLATGINLLKTIARLYRFCRGKHYDLGITDDCLIFSGKLQHIPTWMFTDDDLAGIPENTPFYKWATRILGPSCIDLERFEEKKIPFDGYKELAYLHPKYFTPDKNVVTTFNPDHHEYAIFRSVSLTATHDRGTVGLTDQQIRQLIQLFERYDCRVFITSERPLPAKLDPYKIHIPPQDIAHALYFAKMFIGDSQTMTSESAVLGTPALWFSHFVERKVTVMEEKINRYGLMFAIPPHDFDRLYVKAEELLQDAVLKTTWQEKRQRMLADKCDVTQFLINTIEHYGSFL